MEDFPPYEHIRGKREHAEGANSSDNKNKEGISRRNFLRYALGGMGAAAVAETGIIMELLARLNDIEVWSRERSARMRFDRWHSLSAKEREQLITREVETVGTFIRSAEGKRIFEQGTDKEIFTLLTALPPILRDHIRGTTYDIPAGKWPSVVLGAPVNEVPGVRSISHPAADLRAFYRGNGLFIDHNRILTNWHVLESLLGVESLKEEQKSPEIASLSASYYRHGLDIVQVHMPSDPIREILEVPRIMKIERGLSNNDVHGRLVMVAGIDPDKTADPDGTKLYPSIAVRMTPRLTKFVADYGPREWRKDSDPFYANAFLYLAPPGESLLRLPPSRTGSRIVDLIQGDEPHKATYMHGTSGSPVVMNNQLAGINHRIGNVEYGGLSLDLGFFQGPNEIRQAMSVGMAYDAVKARDAFFKTRRSSAQGGDYYGDYASEGYSGGGRHE